MQANFDYLKTNTPSEGDNLFAKQIPRARALIPNPFERTHLVPTQNFIFLQSENEKNSIFCEASSSLFQRKFNANHQTNSF